MLAVENKKVAAWLVLGNAVFVGLSLLEPIFFRNIIDRLVAIDQTQSSGFTALLHVLLLWLSVGVLLLVVRGAVSLWADRLAHRTNLKLRREYFQKTLNLSMRFHANTHSGKSLKKFNRGSDAIFWTILGFYRSISGNAFTIVLLAPLVIFLNWRLGLLMIIFVLIFFAATIPIMLYANRKQMEIEEFYSHENARVGDAISNIAIVKSFVRIAHELDKFKDIQKQILSKQIPLLTWWALLFVLSRIASTLIFISIFFYGSYLHFQGLASVGDIVMFIGFAVMFLAAIETLLWQSIEIFWRMPGIKEFFEVMDTQKDITDRPEALHMPRVQGKVEFRNVTFSHDGKQQALTNISFIAEPGQIVALVGHTGAGKSTIANLLSRFFDVTDGSVSIDNIDIRDVSQNSLRKNIGVVFQENILFHDSVLENISVGNPEATEAEVIEAAKQARAWEFIERLPDSLHTLVGERGVKLSGGERQRIAIARVILKNPPVLVLDEATSALDAVTEKKLQDALETLMQGRTTFIIAHRLSTIRKADMILVLEHGKIVEQGSYQQLVHQKGIFAEMVEAQTSGFLV